MGLNTYITRSHTDKRLNTKTPMETNRVKVNQTSNIFMMTTHGTVAATPFLYGRFSALRAVDFCSLHAGLKEFALSAVFSL